MVQVVNKYDFKFRDHLNILKKVAMNSSLNNKHSACLMNKNTIYSIGFNRYIKERSSIHAEVDAICKIKNKCLKGIDILIIRINEKTDCKLKNSRPCNACIDKLFERGIRKVYYSNDLGEIVYEYIENMQRIHISSGYIYKNKTGYIYKNKK
jgi:deoxycytidylate deaminase